MPPSLDGVHVAVITVSDRAVSGVRPDATGPVIASAFAHRGARTELVTVSDEVDEVRLAIEGAVASGARAVVTTGGTGVGPRDTTPEATAPLLEHHLPGIPELLRQRDAGRTPLVALSRGLAGVTARPRPAIVVNLPGSPSAVASALEVLPDVLAHAIEQLDGGDH